MTEKLTISCGVFRLCKGFRLPIIFDLPRYRRAWNSSSNSTAYRNDKPNRCRIATKSLIRLPDTFCRSHSYVFGLLFTLSYKNRAADILLLRSQVNHAAITNATNKNFHIIQPFQFLLSGCHVIYNSPRIRQPESLFQLHSTTLHICLHNPVYTPAMLFKAAWKQATRVSAKLKRLYTPQIWQHPAPTPKIRAFPKFYATSGTFSSLRTCIHYFHRHL